jgi:cyclopropane-fatty-acyl-phospholipid synthase
MWIYKLLETDRLPDPLIRWGIRNMLAQKVKEETKPSWEARQQALIDFVEALKRSPIAIETDAANEQHYEVPSEFFDRVLGPRKKYSSAYWHDSTRTLAEAEEIMLALTCKRADVQDGQTILELGCGWGSLSLWLAEKYPNATIVGVSNSRSQKVYIDAQAKARGFNNLEILTANMVHFEIDRQFDRVLSIEMFEHMKNYEQLLARISRWLKPEGKLFVHIFTHPTFAYHYEDKDGTDWLTRYFFTGGTMPSNDLLLYFQKDLGIINQWIVNGTHYQKTANAWAENMYQNRPAVEKILSTTYGADQVKKWWVYWKVFFLACAELWGYKNGNEWMVSHYLFQKKPVTQEAGKPNSLLESERTPV